MRCEAVSLGPPVLLLAEVLMLPAACIVIDSQHRQKGQKMNIDSDAIDADIAMLNLRRLQHSWCLFLQIDRPSTSRFTSPACRH